MELEMVCTCGVDGVRGAEARRLRIFQRMGLDDMSDLTEALVFSLAFDFQAEVEIYVDQWFGIWLESPLVEKGLFIQCDWPVDGLATLWEHLAERFPERVSVKPGDSAAARRVTERISVALLAQYERFDADYRAHREAAHAGPNDCPPCEDCAVGLSLAISAHHALDRVWGSEVLDEAVEKAFDRTYGD